MTFHFNNWLVFFYFYSICGWIFESGNVSIRQRKWVNRGFMKGPWLPLYGSGALVILITSIPFKAHVVAVYFAAAFSATILEYITGVAMLAIFKVRYWDYRYRKLQFQGHICLVSTIVWGFLGIIMVYLVHPHVERLINSWNLEVVSILTFLITLFIVYDFANAFRDAMDLRALILQADKLKKKIEEVVAQKKEKMEQLVDSIIEERQEQLEKKIADMRERSIDNKAELEEALEQLKQRIEQKAYKLLKRNPYVSFHKMEKFTEEIREKLHITWRK